MDFFDCLDISDSKRKDLRKISLLKDNWIGGDYGESINGDTLRATGIFLQGVRRKAADNTLMVPTGAGGVVLTCFDDISRFKASETYPLIKSREVTRVILSRERLFIQSLRFSNSFLITVQSFHKI